MQLDVLAGRVTGERPLGVVNSLLLQVASCRILQNISHDEPRFAWSRSKSPPLQLEPCRRDHLYTSIPPTYFKEESPWMSVSKRLDGCAAGSVCVQHVLQFQFRSILMLSYVKLPDGRLELPNLRQLIIEGDQFFHNDALLGCPNTQEVLLHRPYKLCMSEGLLRVASII